MDCGVTVMNNFAKKMKALAQTKHVNGGEPKHISVALKDNTYTPIARIARATNKSITSVLTELIEDNLPMITTLVLEVEKLAPKERLARPLTMKRQYKPSMKSIKRFAEDKGK